MSILSKKELSTALTPLPKWKPTKDGKKLSRNYAFLRFSDGFLWMMRSALYAEQIDHHPEWSQKGLTISVEMTTHSEGGITSKDIDMAGFMDKAKTEIDEKAQKPKARKQGNPKGWKSEKGAIQKNFTFSSFSTSIAFLTRIAILGEQRGMEPEWQNVYTALSLSIPLEEKKPNRYETAYCLEIDSIAKEMEEGEKQ